MARRKHKCRNWMTVDTKGGGVYVQVCKYEPCRKRRTIGGR